MGKIVVGKCWLERMGKEILKTGWQNDEELDDPAWGLPNLVLEEVQGLRFGLCSANRTFLALDCS